MCTCLLPLRSVHGFLTEKLLVIEFLLNGVMQCAGCKGAVGETAPDQRAVSAALLSAGGACVLWVAQWGRCWVGSDGNGCVL